MRNYADAVVLLVHKPVHTAYMVGAMAFLCRLLIWLHVSQLRDIFSIGLVSWHNETLMRA